MPLEMCVPGLLGVVDPREDPFIYSPWKLHPWSHRFSPSAIVQLMQGQQAMFYSTAFQQKNEFLLASFLGSS